MNTPDSFDVIQTKPSSRIKPIINLIAITIFILLWFVLGWLLGFYMAKHKFKQPIYITMPEEKHNSALISR